MSTRTTYSCIRCSDRKVKCNRQYPCNHCLRHNVQCVFRPPQPPRKRHKRAKDDTRNDRLKHYEALLREQGIDPNVQPGSSESQRYSEPSFSEVPLAETNLQLPTPASTVPEYDRSITKTQLVHGQGRSKFVDNSLWTRVVEEFPDPEDVLEDSSYEASDADASEDEAGFVLGAVPKLNIKCPHPPPELMHQLWQIYVENVDPLTKIVHVPTLQPAIEKAMANVESLPRSFEALMFAIYSTAVLSLKDGECQRILGESRRGLLSRYISATKAALSRSKFMGTISIVVLQALVLHILSVRDVYQPRTVWTLTGVALRIAEGMGMHRDGTSLGLPPFEVEIRRRIWWHLKMHDFRTAELSGLAKFRGINTDFNTSKPLANINDDQLYQGMSSPAIESTKPTDAIFCVLKSELGSFAANHAAKSHQQHMAADTWHEQGSEIDKKVKEEIFKEMENILETKYLRYLDPSQPLQLMAMLFARSALNVGQFMTHHPRIWASEEQPSESEQRKVWHISIKLLEQYDMMQSNRELQRFAWYVAYYLQWHAFIHVLDTLRANPLISEARKAWQLVESIYESYPDMMLNTKRPIYVAVGHLCLKAFNAHEAAFQRDVKSLPPAPEYIRKLRQQREAAKLRRQARDAKGRISQADGSYDQPTAEKRGTRPESSMTFFTSQTESREAQQNPSLPSTGFDQSSYPAHSDTSWFTNNFDTGLLSSFGDVMNIDPDLMLAQDPTVENATNQTIDWSQWDAWMGE